ncbi:hypothetical protein LOK49_LG05G00564 [Camellia lanceoleosa]|uniref:Uncharacterized protein n=1 Tax=Camellia lanceoleosa TaxID=1840588 RepID=A0ACC0HSG0_9ERIC|nr:hypothetical protein LOK49_LG05G00564 [Camellia lanceoleosa]
MSSYISEFNLPKFAEYYLTSYGGDYGNAGTYADPPPACLGLLFPDLDSLPDEEGEFYHTRRGINEYLLTDQAYEGEKLLNYGGTSSWLGPYESFFDGCWGENQFFHGYGVDAFGNSYDSGFEKVEDPYLVQEHHGGYDSHDNGMLQTGYDYNPWSWVEEDRHDYGAARAETTYSYNWDEMKLCESIFGHWPCLLKDNPETYGEQQGPA